MHASNYAKGLMLHTMTAMAVPHHAIIQSLATSELVLIEFSKKWFAD
jgi:hypothetical protein